LKDTKEIDEQTMKIKIREGRGLGKGTLVFGMRRFFTCVLLKEKLEYFANVWNEKDRLSSEKCEHLLGKFLKR